MKAYGFPEQGSQGKVANGTGTVVQEGIRALNAPNDKKKDSAYI